MSLYKKKPSQQKQVALFCTCVLLSSLAWLWVQLSNNHFQQLNVPLAYIAFPKKEFARFDHPKNLKLKVKRSLWQILLGMPLQINTPLRIYFHQFWKKNYVSMQPIVDSLNRQLQDATIVDVQPDTLFFHRSNNDPIKIVPIQIRYQLNFKSPYGLAGPIQCSESTVSVSGPADKLSQLVACSTEVLCLKEVDQSITSTLKLIVPNDLRVFPPSVTVTFPVEEFTEKQLEIPIKVRNNLAEGTVKLLPSQVTISFLTSLSNYNRYNASSFEASVNLKDYFENKATHLPVELNYVAEPGLSRVEVMPKLVDFMVSDK